MCWSIMFSKLSDYFCNYPADKSGYIVCYVQGSAEEQPLADAAFPVKLTKCLYYN